MICTGFAGQTLAMKNRPVPLVKATLRNNLFLKEDPQQCFESRCIPRQRAELRESLRTLGLEVI